MLLFEEQPLSIQIMKFPLLKSKYPYVNEKPQFSFH